MRDVERERERKRGEGQDLRVRDRKDRKMEDTKLAFVKKKGGKTDRSENIA